MINDVQENLKTGCFTFSLSSFDIILFVRCMPRFGRLFRFHFGMVRQFCALLNADPKMDESGISTLKSYLLLQNSSNKFSKTTDLFK